MKVPIALKFHQSLLLLVYLTVVLVDVDGIFSLPGGCGWYLTVVMTNEQHLLMFLLTILLSSFVKCVSPLAIFKNNYIEV